MTIKVAVKSDIVDLPSGSAIDLFQFDVKACRTTDDLHELMFAIEEKIIDIDYQIDCHTAGCHPNGTAYALGERPDPSWLPRAKKAIAISRLQKSEVQVRIQSMAKAANDARNREKNTRFVNTARAKLPKEQFDEIMDHVMALERAGL